MQNITLNNGIEMPILGLGVYETKPTNTIAQAVLAALELGYRLIDTAAIYKNEEQVGEALAQTSLPRSEIFVTTKVWMDDMGYDSTLRAYEASLQKLGTDYVDLYLIHWPKDKALRRSTWQALEQLYADKRVRAIGVSNYYTQHLKELFEYSDIVPAVNQFEYSPYCNPTKEVDFCQQSAIHIQAYAPLVRGLKKEDPRLIAIAHKYNKSTFQLLVRWALQMGASAIPKSVSKDRIAHNADVFDFEIDAEDMATLSTFHDDTRIAWHPDSFE
jgi:methylglyoxal/glyoxal reductase